MILTRGADVDVDVGDDILNGLHYFLEDGAFRKFCLEHF